MKAVLIDGTDGQPLAVVEVNPQLVGTQRMVTVVVGTEPLKMGDGSEFVRQVTMDVHFDVMQTMAGAGRPACIFAVVVDVDQLPMLRDAYGLARPTLRQHRLRKAVEEALQR